MENVSVWSRNWGVEIGIGTLANLESRFELGLGWFCDYDGYDLASLSLLSHGPPVSFQPVCDLAGIQYVG